jgi:hypothetical protein
LLWALKAQNYSAWCFLPIAACVLIPGNWQVLFFTNMKTIAIRWPKIFLPRTKSQFYNYDYRHIFFIKLILYVRVTLKYTDWQTRNEWLTLLHRIRKVPGWNFGPETCYPNWGFLWFPSVPPGKCWYSTLKLGHDRFLPHPFYFIIHMSSFHSALYNLNF